MAKSLDSKKHQEDFSQYMNKSDKGEKFSKYMNPPALALSPEDIEQMEFDVTSYASADCVDEIARTDIDLTAAKLENYCICEEAGEHVVYLIFRLDDDTTWCLKLCRP